MEGCSRRGELVVACRLCRVMLCVVLCHRRGGQWCWDDGGEAAAACVSSISKRVRLALCSLRAGLNSQCLTSRGAARAQMSYAEHEEKKKSCIVM